MNTTGILRGLLSTSILLSACSGKDEPDATATSPASTSTTASTSKGSLGTSADTDTTASGSSDTTSAGTSSTSTTDPTDPSDGTETGCTFLQCGDQGVHRDMCDLWTQDCPEGEKCMPWANDGGSSWNATKCSPLDPAPQQPGDVCTAEGGGVSGVDNCALGSMCWDIDGETDEGYCIAFCEGTSQEDATCEPGFQCNITGDGVLILCIPECDPLLQDCPGDDLCIPSGEAFICVLDASGDAGLYGDPCEYVNVCKPGLYCVNPESVEGCMAAGCCSPFCDTDEANPCPGDTQECIPWYTEGMAPLGKENVGICGIPL